MDKYVSTAGKCYLHKRHQLQGQALIAGGLSPMCCLSTASASTAAYVGFDNQPVVVCCSCIIALFNFSYGMVGCWASRFVLLMFIIAVVTCSHVATDHDYRPVSKSTIDCSLVPHQSLLSRTNHYQPLWTTIERIHCSPKNIINQQSTIIIHHYYEDLLAIKNPCTYNREPSTDH